MDKYPFEIAPKEGCVRGDFVFSLHGDRPHFEWVCINVERYNRVGGYLILRPKTVHDVVEILRSDLFPNICKEIIKSAEKTNLHTTWLYRYAEQLTDNEVYFLTKIAMVWDGR